MPLPDSARTATLNIVRHRGASIVAVSTMAFMLSALTIFVLVTSGLGNAATVLESKANLIADLNAPVSVQQAIVLEQDVRLLWPEATVRYVSKAEALAQFRRTFAGNSTMLSAIDGNPLPASIQIRARNPLVLNKISTYLASTPWVQRVIFNPNLTHKLVEITTVVTIGGVVVLLGLAFLALVIVVNTTHLTVEARRDEIEVMRLLGATHGFVRNPLIAEGVLLGLGGAVLAALVGMGLFLPLVKFLLGGTSNAAALLPISSGTMFLGLLGLFVVLVGAGIGGLGSYVSVRRFARI